MNAKKYTLTSTLALIGLFLVLSGSQEAAAQAAPSSTQPGVVIKGLEGKERQRARLEEVVTVPKMDEATAGVSDKKVFTLKSVVLDNATAYDADDLRSTYGQYLGKTVSFADLNAVARAMTRKYREDGYIFSRIIIPPQKVQDGVVHFRAIEGRIANVQLVGNFKDDNGLVQKLANKIRAAMPTNTADIERYLLLIDDLPGLTARSFIKPSPNTQGAGDLIISVQEDDFEGSVSVDDRGSRYLGPFRGEAVAAFNSALGMHDRTTLRGLTSLPTRELKYGEFSHEQQLGSEGVRLTTRLAVSDTAPGGNVSNLNIDGDSKLLDMQLLYPLLRGRQTNINLTGGFTGVNSESDLDGIKNSADRVRSWKLGSHFDFTDSFSGVNQIEMQLTKGMNALGATKDGDGRSRANGSHSFARGNVTATRIQDLWVADWSLFLSATGQMSSEPLLASEEFAVGGAEFGRAYDAGEIVGDRGYAGVAEVRYGAPISHEYIQSYQLYAFIDAGRVFNVDPAVGENGDDSLASAGLGARFNIVNGISGYVELDSPLTHQIASENDEDSRLFFSVLKRF